MLKGVIFDLDGTITVLTLPLNEMRQDTKKFYIARGLPPELLDLADGISSSTQKAKEYFASQGMSAEEWIELEREVDEVLNRHEGYAAQDVQMIKGSLEAVKSIRDLDLMTAILTNNGRHAVNIIMKSIPLHEFFDVIQTRNEAPNPKPYPDGILHVLRKLELARSEAVYVGDARIDGVAAQRAGIEFWGVSTGETDEYALRDAGASKVFASLNEVYNEIRKCKD